MELIDVVVVVVCVEGLVVVVVVVCVDGFVVVVVVLCGLVVVVVECFVGVVVVLECLEVVVVVVFVTPRRTLGFVVQVIGAYLLQKACAGLYPFKRGTSSPMIPLLHDPAALSSTTGTL